MCARRDDPPTNYGQFNDRLGLRTHVALTVPQRFIAYAYYIHIRVFYYVIIYFESESSPPHPTPPHPLAAVFKRKHHCTRMDGLHYSGAAVYNPLVTCNNNTPVFDLCVSERNVIHIPIYNINWHLVAVCFKHFERVRIFCKPPQSRTA